MELKEYIAQTFYLLVFKLYSLLIAVYVYNIGFIYIVSRPLAKVIGLARN